MCAKVVFAEELFFIHILVFLEKLFDSALVAMAPYVF
jgi:hypothetical protein